MIERRRSHVAMVLIALVASLAGFYIGQAGFVPDQLLARIRLPGLLARSQRSPVDVSDWTQFNLVRQHIRARYVEPVSDEALVRAAIDGLVRATGDRYATYMPPQQYANYLQHFQDHFGGVGIRIERRGGYLTVVAPIRGSPGDMAGLKSGDRVVAVDEHQVQNLSLEEVVPLIRGPIGTKVKLTVERDQRTFTVEIVRANIPMPQVDSNLLPGESGIGYMHIYTFNQGLHERVKEGLSSLRAAGMRGLILDLRQNPGGLLSEAVEVSSLFVPAGPVVHIVERSGARQSHDANGRGFDLPLVVLVDEGTASAAEILAGAIRDRRTGVLVGTRTFGKGSVQSFFDLPDGAGLKLTTARYLTAGGHSINGVGIDPDVVVLQPVDQQLDLENPAGPQMRKAIEVLEGKLR